MQGLAQYVAYPLISDLEPDSLFLARGGQDQWVFASNTSSNIVHILDCTNIYVNDYCLDIYHINDTNFGFGDGPIYFQGVTIGPLVIIPDRVGYLHTYICGEYCVPQKTIYTGANDAPYAIQLDNAYYQSFGQQFIAVAYGDYQYNGPAVIVLDCADPTNCFIYTLLQNFKEDCLTNYDAETCFSGGVTGEISVAVEAAFIAIGFPTANNNRGLVMYYVCNGPCVYNNTLSNGDQYDYGNYVRGQQFGSSVSLYEGQLFIGEPGIATYDYGNGVTNLFVGGGIVVDCDTGAYPFCGGIGADNRFYEFYWDSDFYGNCFLLNQNFGFRGQYLLDTRTIFVTSPIECNGVGIIYDFYQTGSNYTYDASYVTNDYYLGDSYGLSLQIGYEFIMSNSAQRGYIVYSPEFLNQTPRTKYVPKISRGYFHNSTLDNVAAFKKISKTSKPLFTKSSVKPASIKKAIEERAAPQRAIQTNKAEMNAKNYPKRAARLQEYKKQIDASRPDRIAKARGLKH